MYQEVKMHKLTDNELMEEVKRRFEDNNRSLHDLRVMTKKLEDVNRKLQESESLKSNFLANIRNEINNPLMSILGLSEELTSTTPSDIEEVTKLAEIIYSEAFELDLQLRNIFAAADLEAGETVHSIARVNIDKLLGSTIETFIRRADEKKIKVSYEPMDKAGDDPHFNTDSEKLHIIMSNLVDNAIKFNQEGGLVELTAWIDNEQLNITVKDSGIGINESELGVIFDRFKQLDSGLSKSHKGHGIGLSVTKALIELLNGTIAADNVDGKGSIFRVAIPASESDTDVDMLSEDGNEFIFIEEATEF
jgi:signal transduction histidine kinase